MMADQNGKVLNFNVGVLGILPWWLAPITPIVREPSACAQLLEGLAHGRRLLHVA